MTDSPFLTGRVGRFFRSWRLLGASLQVLSGGLGRLLVVMSGSLKGATVGGTARQPTTVWMVLKPYK